MLPLEIDRRQVPKRRMSTMGIVPRLNEREDRHASLGLRAEATAREQLAFERSKEALAHRIDRLCPDQAAFLGVTADMRGCERRSL